MLFGSNSGATPLPYENVILPECQKPPWSLVRPEDANKLPFPYPCIFREKRVKRRLHHDSTLPRKPLLLFFTPRMLHLTDQENKREKLRSYLDCQVSAPPGPWFWIGFLMISLLAICFGVRAPFLTCSLEAWWMAASSSCPCFFWESPPSCLFSWVPLKIPPSLLDLHGCV